MIQEFEALKEQYIADNAKNMATMDHPLKGSS